jgi:Uma2 family endonuclease
MVEILELPEVRRQVARTSVDAFHRGTAAGFFGKRTELLRGIVLEKMAVSPLHRRLGLWLYDTLSLQAGADWAVFHESPLTLADSEPQPDVMVAAGRRSDYRDVHPTTAELVIEVAVTSEALDRVNAALYAEAGVKEYWIVLANRRQIEVYRRPVAGEYCERQTIAGDEDLICAAVPCVRVSLPALFA